MRAVLEHSSFFRSPLSFLSVKITKGDTHRGGKSAPAHSLLPFWVSPLYPLPTHPLLSYTTPYKNALAYNYHTPYRIQIICTHIFSTIFIVRARR